MDDLKGQIAETIVEYAIVGTITLVCFGAIQLFDITKNKVKSKLKERRI